MNACVTPMRVLMIYNVGHRTGTDYQDFEFAVFASAVETGVTAFSVSIGRTARLNRLMFCLGGGIGRHKGLKIPRSQGHTSSSLVPGTNALRGISALSTLSVFYPISTLKEILPLVFQPWNYVCFERISFRSSSCPILYSPDRLPYHEQTGPISDVFSGMSRPEFFDCGALWCVVVHPLPHKGDRVQRLEKNPRIPNPSEVRADFGRWVPTVYTGPMSAALFERER